MGIFSWVFWGALGVISLWMGPQAFAANNEKEINVYKGCQPARTDDLPTTFLKLDPVPSYRIDTRGTLLVTPSTDETVIVRPSRDKPSGRNQEQTFVIRNRKTGLQRRYTLINGQDGYPEKLTYQTYTLEKKKIRKNGKRKSLWVEKMQTEQQLSFSYLDGRRCVLNEAAKKITEEGKQKVIVTYSRPFCKEVAQLEEVADQINDTAHIPERIERRRAEAIDLVFKWDGILTKDQPGRVLDRVEQWEMDAKGVESPPKHVPYGLKLNERCSAFNTLFVPEKNDGADRTGAGQVPAGSVPEADADPAP